MASDGQDGGASQLAASEGVPYAQASDALQLAVVADNAQVSLPHPRVFPMLNQGGGTFQSVAFAAVPKKCATCPDSLFVGTCWTCGKYCCNQCYRCVKNDGGGVFRCGECRARLRGQRRPQLAVFTTPVRLAYDGDTYTYAEYVEFYGEQGAARM